jgi:hypothetical protein
MASYGTWASVSALTLCACNERAQPLAAPLDSSTSALSALEKPPTTATSLSPSTPKDPQASELNKAFAQWNDATNRADASLLERFYAPRLSLYGRIAQRAEAVKRKLEYVAAHPGFEQTISGVTWETRDETRLVRFHKTSKSTKDAPTTVDAYLLWRKLDGQFLIQDEGDVPTARKLEAKLDVLRTNWTPKPYPCPGCVSEELGDDTPRAEAPLGPDTVKAHGAVPPGAPATISYGRVIFPRFASAVDVPLFLTATPQSGNGDGRWFYYQAPDAAAKAAPGEEPESLLYCAIGGSLAWEPPPADAKPDPGHKGEPKISFKTVLERSAKELHYVRNLYGADGVNNFVDCTIALPYEAYFYAIVDRMGHSMRAVSGGQAERKPRVSQPYTPFDP